MSDYKALEFSPLPLHSSFFRPEKDPMKIVTDDHPAVDVMTDLRRVMMLTVAMTTPLDLALDRMIRSGVRMLLVTEKDNGEVMGLITARDIEGERPQKIMEKTGFTLGELLVRDIMVLKQRVEALDMSDVEQSRVGDIIATLRGVDRQHALVVQTDPETDNKAVIGIFSLSQIARQLGLEIDPARGATTFEELAAAGHGG